MFYKIEFDVDAFEFWSGARDRMRDATDEQRDEVADRLEDVFEGQEPTETEVNDYVWFECDDIFYPDEEDED